MVAIKTEISESIDTAPSEVEVEQTQTINEVIMISLIYFISKRLDYIYSLIYIHIYVDKY